MDKRAFIQQVVIHYRVPVNKLGDAIGYAESAWAELSARGYGAPQKGAERRTEDYYSKLPPEQQDRFDKFWTAFRKKDGKQRAAKSWLKINPDAEVFRSIMQGAEYEARIRNDRGTTPPFAELWLNEQRWMDAPVANDTPMDDAKDDGSGDRAHCIQMAQLFDRQGDTKMADYWRAQAEK